MRRVSLLLASAIAARLSAQPTSAARLDVSDVSSPSRNWCFAPHQELTCWKFWITELSFYRAGFTSRYTDTTASGPVIRRDLGNQGNLVIGGMVNHGPSAAFGAAVMFGNGEAGERMGVEARARRWLGPSTAVDVSAGPFLAVIHAHSLSDETTSPAVGADVSLMWFDWVGVTARGEAVRAEGRTRHALYAGFRLGSYPGVITAIAAAALVTFLRLVSGPN
jgi:hypothetical protein